MVHALEEIHRLLRPDGCLIAIRPVSGASLSEVYQDSKALFAEPVPVPAYDREVISKAEDALAQVIERGLFVVERGGEFEYLQYGSSVGELLDYLTTANAFHEWPKDETVAAREAELAARVEAVMQEAGAGAEVATHEKARIARLRPIM